MNINYENEYNKASDKWPKINWDKSKYIDHVQQAGGSHYLDLYPAGAAGYRTQQAWHVIEEDFRPTVCQRIKFIAKADYAIEDIWSITRLHLMEEDINKPKLESDMHPARIIQYKGNTDLTRYLTSIACQKAQMRYRKIKDRTPLSIDQFKDNENGKYELEEKNTPNPLNMLADEEVIIRFQKTLKETFDSLDADHRYLLQMVLIRKMKKKEAGEKIGLNEWNTSRALKKIKETLSAKMQNYHELWDNKPFRDTWTDMCKRCLDQEDQDK